MPDRSGSTDTPWCGQWTPRWRLPRLWGSRPSQGAAGRLRPARLSYGTSDWYALCVDTELPYPLWYHIPLWTSCFQYGTVVPLKTEWAWGTRKEEKGMSTAVPIIRGEG